MPPPAITHCFQNCTSLIGSKPPKVMLNGKGLYGKFLEYTVFPLLSAPGAN